MQEEKRSHGWGTDKVPGCLLLPLHGHRAKSAFEGGFHFYPGSSCQDIWQTSWCFCMGVISGNFGLPWRVEADQACTGCSVSAAFPMCGHSIAVQPCHRSNACWWHCTYPAHKTPSVQHTHNMLTAFQKPGGYRGGIMLHMRASLYPKSPREKHDSPQHGLSFICRKAWPSLLNGPSARPRIRNSSGVQAVLQKAA